MKKENIIQMAREAGACDISSHGWTSWVGTQSTDFLERFAQLVAAAERNELVEIMYNLDLCGREGVAVEAIRARGQK